MTDPTDVVKEIERLFREAGPTHSCTEIHPVRCRDCAVCALRDIALRLAERIGSFRDIEKRETILLEENARLKAEVGRLRKFDNRHPKRCKCVECGP